MQKAISIAFLLYPKDICPDILSDRFMAYFAHTFFAQIEGLVCGDIGDASILYRLFIVLLNHYWESGEKL